MAGQRRSKSSAPSRIAEFVPEPEPDVMFKESWYWEQGVDAAKSSVFKACTNVLSPLIDSTDLLFADLDDRDASAGNLYAVSIEGHNCLRRLSRRSTSELMVSAARETNRHEAEAAAANCSIVILDRVFAVSAHARLNSARREAR